MPARDVAGRGFAATRRISARGVRVPVEVGWHDPFRREGGRGVSAKRKSKKNTAALRDERCFRHWVELRDLRDDVVRVLSVAVFQRIALVSKSKLDEPEQSPQISLRVQDVGRIWEASSVEDLAAQLREAYPDGVFVALLKCERDLEAEARRRTALNNLIEVLAEPKHGRCWRRDQRLTPLKCLATCPIDRHPPASCESDDASGRPKRLSVVSRVRYATI